VASGRSARLILSTAPAAVAGRLATALVKARLAACVSLVGGLRSTYRWRGRVERAQESLLVVKTSAGKARACLERLRALHPYEVPEGLVLEPSLGLVPYLAWIAEETA
jgi:periplasmic divalent cation tolerance protein